MKLHHAIFVMTLTFACSGAHSPAPVTPQPSPSTAQPSAAIAPTTHEAAAVQEAARTQNTAAQEVTAAQETTLPSTDEGTLDIDAEPLLVVYVKDPWLWVIGADSPRFALYDNGLAIFGSDTSTPPRERFQYVYLSAEERQALFDSLDLKARIGENQGFLLELTADTDQPTNEIHSWQGDEPYGVAIYGNLEGDLTQLRTAFPDISGIFDIFQTVLEFSHPQARPWFPQHIEVLLGDYDHSPNEPQPWPEGWPVLQEEQLQDTHPGSRSILLDAKHFDDFIQLTQGLEDRQALLLNGRKWSASLRLPFPLGF